ncbi:helix-turn-helix domain-containing protein [Nonomuraea sp. NPDC048892]|uniref:helix-turn-helix domain-containing protein n=1 Tax=Nonomuraea sp. NPDC048892 TaxID=3154624 RepID=UPI0034064ABE
MVQIVKRAYKYRFYPTPEQASQLARTFGCVCLVYNKALEERTRAYTQEGRRVSYAESSAMLTERKRSGEFGIMHAIGARPRTVRRIVAAEGLLLAVAGCVAAVVPAVVLTWLLGAGLGNLFMNVPIPFRISALGAVIWVVLALLGAALATDAAAARASRLTVREALAYL